MTDISQANSDREGRRGYSAPARVTLVGEDAYILSSLHEARLAELRAENKRLREDVVTLGASLADLYLQAINGVVCDPTEEPGRHNCRPCREAWKHGIAVVERYDGKWGNGFRSGPSFQPDFAGSIDEQKVATCPACRGEGGAFHEHASTLSPWIECKTCGGSGSTREQEQPK